MILTKSKDIVRIAKEMGKIKNVKAIYVFGSYASNKQTLLSDIDLCIIGNLTEKEKAEIAGFGSDNLDISFFDELPIYIKFRVLRDGKALIIKDEKFLHIVKIKILREYLDFKPLINKYIEKTLQNVR